MILKSWLLVTISFYISKLLRFKICNSFDYGCWFYCHKASTATIRFFKEFCLNCFLIWLYNSQSVRYVSLLYSDSKNDFLCD